MNNIRKSVSRLQHIGVNLNRKDCHDSVGAGFIPAHKRPAGGDKPRPYRVTSIILAVVHFIVQDYSKGKILKLRSMRLQRNSIF
jgi:hypothetical protein